MSSRSSSSKNTSVPQLSDFSEKHFTLWKMQTLGTFLAYGLVEVCETSVASKLIGDERSRVAVAKKESKSLVSSSSLAANESSGDDVMPATMDTTSSASSSSSSAVILLSKDAAELVSCSKRAYGALVRVFGPSQLRLVQHIALGDAYGVWSVLLDTYERSSMATKVQWIEQLVQLKLRSNESVNLYVARMNDLQSKLLEQDEKIGSSMMLYFLLNGLSAEYDTLVTLLKMKGECKFEEAVEALKNEEERLKLKLTAGKGKGGAGGRREEAAHYSSSTAGTSGSSRCYTCQSIGHVMYDCPKNKNIMKCSRCRRLGHEVKKCRAVHIKKEQNDEDDDFAALAMIKAMKNEYEEEEEEKEEEEESDDEWN